MSTMSTPITDPPRVRLICTGTETRGLHDARIIGVAAWLDPSRMKIVPPGGEAHFAELVSQTNLTYDIECGECRGRIRMDRNAWRQRLEAAAPLSGVGQLDISNDLK